MLTPIKEIPVDLLSCEKDVLCGLLSIAPPDTILRDSIIESISNSGEMDGPVQLSSQKVRYLAENLVHLSRSELLKGTKYDTALCREMAQHISSRLQGLR